MKRERVALDEVRRLLAEMREAAKAQAAKAQSDQSDRDG